MDNYLKLSHTDQDELLDAQRSSGQTVRSFCKDHGIKESRFYSWRTRRNRGQNSKEQAGFTQLQPTAPGHLSVRLRSGFCLQFEVNELPLAADLLLLMDRRHAQL